MKIGHLNLTLYTLNFASPDLRSASHSVRSVINPDEIPAQRTCHTDTSWYCGGREGENHCVRKQAKRSEVKQHSSFVS